MINISSKNLASTEIIMFDSSSPNNYLCYVNKVNQGFQLKHFQDSFTNDASLFSIFDCDF